MSMIKLTYQNIQIDRMYFLKDSIYAVYERLQIQRGKKAESDGYFILVSLSAITNYHRLLRKIV